MWRDVGFLTSVSFMKGSKHSEDEVTRSAVKFSAYVRSNDHHVTQPASTGEVDTRWCSAMCFAFAVKRSCLISRVHFNTLSMCCPRQFMCVEKKLQALCSLMWRWPINEGMISDHWKAKKYMQNFSPETRMKGNINETWA